MDFASTVHADMAALMPGAERLSGRTLVYTGGDMREVFGAFRALQNLAGSV